MTTLVVLLLTAYMVSTGFVPNAILYFFSVNFLILMLILLVYDFYQQRFFIDRKKEWGLHWRAGLLRLAKYPYLILALCQVILNRKFEYVITSKVKNKTSNFKLFLPHLAVAVLLCVAWIFGMVVNNGLSMFIHFAVGLILIGAIILICTSFKKFPPPFDLEMCSSVIKRYQKRFELREKQ